MRNTRKVWSFCAKETTAQNPCSKMTTPSLNIFLGSRITVGFQHFSPFQQVKALAVLCQAVPVECIGKHFQISPPSKSAVLVAPWLCMGGNGAFLRAGAPWLWGAPLGVFSLQPSERCLIEILSLPGIILREADECCGIRFSCSPEILSIQKLV